MSRFDRLVSPALRLLGRVRPWTGVIGLNYHRIGDGQASLFDRGVWSASTEEFDRQLRWVKDRFDVISPRDLPYVVRVKRGRHVLVTFDDGYIDNYTEALPVLRSHRLPATFFIATGFIDKPRIPWWDQLAWRVRTSERKSVEMPGFLSAPVALDEPGRQKAIFALILVYKALPTSRTGAFLEALAEGTGTTQRALPDARQMWMTWDMVRELRDAGMTIGGHTVSHELLSQMPRESQWAEITGCALRLEQELGLPMRYFSYPVGSPGSFNADTRSCLREAGVQAAFTYQGGLQSLSAWDAYAIPRLAVDQIETSFDAFRTMILKPPLRARRFDPLQGVGDSPPAGSRPPPPGS